MNLATHLIRLKNRKNVVGQQLRLCDQDEDFSPVIIVPRNFVVICKYLKLFVLSLMLYYIEILLTKSNNVHPH